MSTQERYILLLINYFIHLSTESNDIIKIHRKQSLRLIRTRRLANKDYKRAKGAAGSLGASLFIGQRESAYV